MRRDDSTNLIENQNERNIFKMTKSRTAMFLVMIIISCGLIFSITEAYPAAETETSPDSDMKVGNNSRLVITHVVKTIEFEVGLVDDDGVVNDNVTDTNDSNEFYETDIQLLNVDLLKEIVNQASDEDNKEKQTEEPTKTQESQLGNTTQQRVKKSTS